MATVTVPSVSAPLSRLLDPGDSAWSGADVQTIDMAPTPMGFQPSMYVIASWKDRAYGQLQKLSVKALHNGKEIAFRLEWEEPEPSINPQDINLFADGAGVLFPVDGKQATIESMGTPEQPVNAWYWRPNLQAAIHGIGLGAGTLQRLTDGAVSGNGVWSDGRWRVVIGRDFTASEGVKIEAPGSVNGSFAIWRGANHERAGVKAFGQTWHEIRLL